MTESAETRGTTTSLNLTSNSALNQYYATLLPEFTPSKEKWAVWKQKFDLHLMELNITEENAKKVTLLKLVGTEAYNTLHSVCSPKAPVSLAFKELCKLLDTHYMPPVIVFHERKKFHGATKDSCESVAEWYARVKKLALSCKFDNNLDAFILNQFVMGLPEKIFERMCEEDEKLTADEALRKAMILETKLAAKSSDVDVSAVNYIKHRCSKGESRNNNSHNRNNCRGNTNNNRRSSEKKNEIYVPTAGGKITHQMIVGTKIAHAIVVTKLDTWHQYAEISPTNINTDDNVGEMYSLSVVIDGTTVEATCDTGAPCIMVAESFFKKLKDKTLLKCNTPYINYSGNKIEILGEYDALITYLGITKKLKVVVSRSRNQPLLGRSFLRAFGFELLQVNTVITESDCDKIVTQIKQRYSNVFTNKLGKYRFSEVSLSLKENAIPIFCKPRSLPLAWKDKVETKLRDMISMDVLEIVDNSDWGTPLVPVLKPNGDLRICADYKVTINKYLNDVKYPLPRIEEIFASLEGGRIFTKLDLSNAYNQLVLDSNSQQLCTWSTHIGTLKVKRLPFGVKTAASIFQKTVENLFRGIPHVVVYQDDITITGRNLQEHLKTLDSVLSKLSSAGLTLNESKCIFFKSEVTYLGFKIDKFGLRKTPERVSCIKNAPAPTNVTQLKAFAGMVNYYSKFVFNFADKMKPLYNLLCKNVKFIWSRECQKAYEQIKSDLISDQVLIHFNANLPIILTTDASNNAVAGVLSHKLPDDSIRPIAFVSRALTKSELNYAPIEKEGLAIIFSVSKLRQYLLGNKFKIFTDHKPLLSLFGETKGIPAMAAARMQRWAVILSGFDYVIEYVKGNSNHADGLSRMPQSVIVEDVVEGNYVNLINAENCIHIDFQDIARETRRDPIFSKICEAIQSGTLHNMKDSIYEPFRNKANELNVEYGCIMWGYRSVIPPKFRQELLQQLHVSHLGIVKTKALARSYMWWPSLDSDIEKLIKNCFSCQELQASPEKSKLIPWKPTDSVWSRVHADFAGPIKNYYLFIVVDSFSKWVEVYPTKDITSNFIINKMRTLFARYGIIDTFVSDNGRQFISEKFQEFLKINGVRHVLTAPGHPATNGQAENFVKMLKKSIYANLRCNNHANLNTIICRFLADYRNTKHCTTNETPSLIFLKRTPKTRFNLIKPPLVQDTIVRNQNKSIINYRGKRNVEFNKGEKVWVRDYSDPNKAGWSSATINKQLGPRTYLCILTNNRQIKRHLNQIRSPVLSAADNNSTVHDEATTPNDVATFTSEVVSPESEGIQTDINSNSHTHHHTVAVTPRRQLRPRQGGKVVKP